MYNGVRRKGARGMLDERDLQAIAQLMARQKTDIVEMMTQQTAQQKAEILDTMTRQMAQQKAEIMHEVGALIEVEVTPRFNLLADGYKLILEKLSASDPLELERVESRVDVLETVVKVHSREIDKLKKAQ